VSEAYLKPKAELRGLGHAGGLDPADSDSGRERKIVRKLTFARNLHQDVW